MVQWFRERYVSREEHQQVVDYYRKLVAQLYGNVRDLRALVEAQRADIPQTMEQSAGAEQPAEASTESAEILPQKRDLGPNVISIGLYRDRRRSGI